MNINPETLEKAIAEVCGEDCSVYDYRAKTCQLGAGCTCKAIALRILALGYAAGAEEERERLKLYRAGPILKAIVDALQRQNTWTIEEFKSVVSNARVQYKNAKEIYNAAAYLVRKGKLNKTGYGSFVCGESIRARSITEKEAQS